MLDDILQRRPKKHVKDLNIVPILDMLTTVIFFLLMSTSFIEYTKLTLPPASTSSAPIESKEPPVAPKVLVSRSGDQYSVKLQWGGERPGQQTVEAAEDTLISKTQELLRGFSQRYPNEKTLQISMGRFVKYQALISVMDGSREFLPDMVLMSYSESP